MTSSRSFRSRLAGRSVRAKVGIAIVVAALVATSCSSGTSKSTTEASTQSGKRPNVVFILTDDLSWNLINKQFAPHIVQLEQRGETFDHYFVADSLCCPSRSTIFTGLFPHDTKVETNLPPNGGYQKFQSQGLAGKTFAVALHSAGYEMSMIGKYLNGYGNPRPTLAIPPPPGWSDWHVSNDTGYLELNFLLNDNGTVHSYTGPNNYGTDVYNGDLQSFIKRSAGRPFMAEVATFAPHQPYTPAPRNSNDFPGLTEPRDPSFNTNNVNPPAWLGQRRALGPKQITNIDQAYRKRAQSVEAVDKLVADTEATLAAEHLTNDTYIVFSSDNGYHLGQHRLARGKQTAFDTDIRVPLIVAGPGVPHGRVMPQVVQNTDLYPTFVQLAGATPAAPIDGHSLVPLLHPSKGSHSWPTVALVEHRGNTQPGDPDFEGGGSNPTTYEAIRVSAKHLPHFKGPVEAVYVEYQDQLHETEYYDISKDPYEIHNIAGQLTADQRTELHNVLVGLVNCHQSSTCWNAAMPS